MVHSPFHVIHEFLSPLLCDQMIQELGIKTPSFELDEETPIPNHRLLTNTRYHNIVKNRAQDEADAIEKRYDATIVGMNEPQFSQYFENPKAPCVAHGCENSKFLRKKWVKVKDIDLVGYVWLKDFNNGVPLDPSFEVYGSKLEFPAYDFSLMPKRGTCVIFPAGPHFISAVSHVFAGSTEFVKFGLKLETNDIENSMWFYQPSKFPGTYKDWFKGV